MRFELKDPTKIAEAFDLKNEERYIFIDGQFYWNAECHYQLICSDEINSWCFDFLKDLFKANKLDKPPKKKDVEEVVAALKSLKFMKIGEEPAWLDGRKESPRDFIPLANTLFNFKTKVEYCYNLDFFNTTYINIKYQPEKGMPKQFLNFLNSLWGDDMASIETLQEIFGLFLTYKTEFQKAFMLIGPKRSGKSTIIRILLRLIGDSSVASPTFNNLSNQFGLANLIDKRAAFIPDARFSLKADTSAAIEAILRITGEDTISIPRKYQKDWTGKLYTRFFICSNEVPTLPDSSNALASRFIVLKMTKSFYGNEDSTLFGRLSTEMPEILNWSLVGLDRLLQRGHFIQPRSAVSLIEQMNELGSPLDSFISECCVLDPSLKIKISSLFEVFKNWNFENNNPNVGTVQLFSKNIYAATHRVKTQQLTVNGKKLRFYVGIDLKPEFKSIFENA